MGLWQSLRDQVRFAGQQADVLDAAARVPYYDDTWQAMRDRLLFEGQQAIEPLKYSYLSTQALAAQMLGQFRGAAQALGAGAGQVATELRAPQPPPTGTLADVWNPALGRQRWQNVGRAMGQGYEQGYQSGAGDADLRLAAAKEEATRLGMPPLAQSAIDQIVPSPFDLAMPLVYMLPIYDEGKVATEAMEKIRETSGFGPITSREVQEVHESLPLARRRNLSPVDPENVRYYGTSEGVVGGLAANDRGGVDIVGVANPRGGKLGAGARAMTPLIEQAETLAEGAPVTLDAFTYPGEGRALENLYTSKGFEITGRAPYNPALDPTGKYAAERPDVFFAERRAGASTPPNRIPLPERRIYGGIPVPLEERTALLEADEAFDPFFRAEGPRTWRDIERMTKNYPEQLEAARQHLRETGAAERFRKMVLENEHFGGLTWYQNPELVQRITDKVGPEEAQRLLGTYALSLPLGSVGADTSVATGRALHAMGSAARGEMGNYAESAIPGLLTGQYGYTEQFKNIEDVVNKTRQLEIPPPSNWSELIRPTVKVGGMQENMLTGLGVTPEGVYRGAPTDRHFAGAFFPGEGKRLSGGIGQKSFSKAEEDALQEMVFEESKKLGIDPGLAHASSWVPLVLAKGSEPAGVAPHLNEALIDTAKKLGRYEPTELLDRMVTNQYASEAERNAVLGSPATWQQMKEQAAERAQFKKRSIAAKKGAATRAAAKAAYPGAGAPVYPGAIVAPDVSEEFRTAFSLRSPERAFGPRSPDEVPAVPALAQRTRANRLGWAKKEPTQFRVVVQAPNSFATHDDLYAHLPELTNEEALGPFGPGKADTIPGFIDKKTGQFLDLHQARERYGDYETTSMALTALDPATGRPLRGAAAPSERTAAQIIDAAKREVGTASRLTDASFVFPDGSLLATSGRYGTHLESLPSGYTSVGQFQRDTGSIRFTPDGPGLELTTPPSKSQRDMISRLVRERDGEIIVDISSPTGETSFSKSYRSGTRPAKVLRDIDQAFSPEGPK